MLKNSVLKVFMVILVVIALLVPATVYADDEVQIIAPSGNTAATPSTTTVTPASPSPVVASPKASPVVVQTTPATGKIPQTGIEDYTGIIVAVVVLGGTAIFALKKMKDYKQL